METQTKIPDVMENLAVIPDLVAVPTSSTLHHLVDNITESFAPVTSRNNCLVINDVSEDIPVNNDRELVTSLLSNLMNLVFMHTENSRIRITAKLYRDVVLLHVKDDGCLNYDSVSQKLACMRAMAEQLGGFVGFTSYRNKLTTIAFSFMNRCEAA